jgi:hypothetical protein
MVRALVMAMAVSRDSTFALTVSADNLIGKYDLMVTLKQFFFPVSIHVHGIYRIQANQILLSRLPAPFIGPSILEILLLPYETMEKYVLLADGMESELCRGPAILFLDAFSHQDSTVLDEDAQIARYTHLSQGSLSDCHICSISPTCECGI